MRRFWKFALVVIALLGFAFWWLMPLKVERTFLVNISPNFQSWCATDLDGDSKAEILLSYPNKPPVLVQMQGDDFETTNLLGVDNVVLPSPDNPQRLLLPLAKSVPAKTKGRFWLMRIEKGLVSLHQFPKVERADYVVWLDADNDGKLNDLIVRSGEKRFWFTMEENGEWVFKAQLTSGPKRNLVGVADLDKDSKPEFIAGGQNYSVLWGNGEPENKLGSNSELSEVQVTDLDNDGPKEIVALKRDGAFSRLVIWKYESSQKGLVASISPHAIPHATVAIDGQKFPQGLDNLWIADLNGDGLKEVVAYPMDEQFKDILLALAIQARLKALVSSRVTFPVVTIPSPSSPKRVSFATSSCFLVALGGKPIKPREFEPVKEAQQPITCFRFGNQSLLLTEQWKHLRRFKPRFHSLNPLVVTWWEEEIVKQGALWQVSSLVQAKTVRCKKVLELLGSPRLIADLNGDGLAEIFWVREFAVTPSKRRVMGITAWKLGKWRKTAWVLAEQEQYPQITSTPTSPTHSILSALSRLTAVHSLPTQQIRLLPIKTDNGFDILVASPDGAIERVRVK